MSSKEDHQSLWPTRRTTKSRIKRRKLPSIRLGEKRRRGGHFFIRIFRRLKLRRLRLKYSKMLKKLKAYYSSVVKDCIEGGATVDGLQQRVMLSTYFSLPGMAGSVANMPSYVDCRALK